MAKFNAAKMLGAQDKKFQDAYNQLIDLLDTGYIVEKTIDGKRLRIVINNDVGIAFYGDSVYRGGIVVRDDELTLLTDVVGTVDDSFHFIKFDKHELYGVGGEEYSLFKFHASDNAASPAAIETFRIASRYWEATDTAQTFFGIGTNGTTVDAADIYLSAGMCLETPVGTSFVHVNSSPQADTALIELLAINPSENSSGFQIYANGTDPKIDVMVDYTDSATFYSDRLKVDGGLSVLTLPSHANNAAAIAGGLVAGDFYRTGGDPDLVCVVH